MMYDFKSAFTYIKSDKDWLKKYAMCLGAMLLVLVPFVGAVASMILLFGYAMSNTNRRIFKPKEPLFEWRFLSALLIQ